MVWVVERVAIKLDTTLNVILIYEWRWSESIEVAQMHLINIFQILMFDISSYFLFLIFSYANKTDIARLESRIEAIANVLTRRLTPTAMPHIDRFHVNRNKMNCKGDYYYIKNKII